ESGITVKGVNDVLARFAKCCTPVPGDPIVGFITRGRGITVHTRDCPNLTAGGVDSERTVGVEWDVAEKQAPPVQIAMHLRPPSRAPPPRPAPPPAAVSPPNSRRPPPPATPTSPRPR